MLASKTSFSNMQTLIAVIDKVDVSPLPKLGWFLMKKHHIQKEDRNKTAWWEEESQNTAFAQCVAATAHITSEMNHENRILYSHLKRSLSWEVLGDFRHHVTQKH